MDFETFLKKYKPNMELTPFQEEVVRLIASDQYLRTYLPWHSPKSDEQTVIIYSTIIDVVNRLLHD